MEHSITNIQSTLDENKKNMTDKVYLTLCNQMKKLYSESKLSETSGIFKIKYEVIIIKPTQTHRNCFVLDSNTKLSYVNLVEEEYLSLKRCLDNDITITSESSCWHIFRNIYDTNKTFRLFPCKEEIQNLEFDDEDIDSTIECLGIQLEIETCIKLLKIRKI